MKGTEKRFITCFYFLWAFFLLCSCPILGQERQKRQLTEKDYEKWGNLAVKAMSNNGKWISYAMTYPNKKDTLFLQHTEDNTKYSFPSARDGRFGHEDVFACLKSDTLIMQSLHNTKSEIIRQVKQYDFSEDGKRILVWHTNNQLVLKNNKGNTLEKLENIISYTFHDASQTVVYCQKEKDNYKVGCIELTANKHFTITSDSTVFHQWLWDEEGKAILFFKENDLVYYRLKEKKLVMLTAEKLQNEGLKIVTGSFAPIRIAIDGKKVFFSVAHTSLPKPNDNNSVELWKGNDNPLFSVQQELNQLNRKVAVWFPDDGKFNFLTNDTLLRHRLTGCQDYAILSNPYQYSLEPVYHEEVDYYLKNVKTGEEKLLIKKQSHDSNQLCFSPWNNTFLYYKEAQWWLYNPDNDKTICLTKGIKTHWDNTSKNTPSQFEVHGVAGWSKDGKSVLIYDTNDIWKIALDGNKGIRLTRGKEEGKIYRITRESHQLSSHKTKDVDTRPVFDITKDLVLEVKSPVDWKTGYAIYHPKLGIKELVYGERYYNAIKKRGNHYIYCSQTFSESPKIHYRDSQRGNDKILFESNPQQAKYYYGKSEIVYYTNSEGNVLKGALFYPANYDSTKQYPMIVHIYEQQSHRVHRYQNPTLLNYEGFNVSHFTLKGYFVLLPDIEYKPGNPAVSANDCVDSAVKTIIASGKINAKRIGLMGHSFGGYETNYIITQNHGFAAAVSGGSVSNTLQHYFNISASNIHKNEMWRYESQQYRMGTSFYQSKENYLNNWPIKYADSIKTPLLLWAGKNDKVVPFEQSVSFYMALRRLRLKTLLLAYPNEDHTISNSKNQIDLTQRITAWFDYYLKEEDKYSWITEGTNYD